ncbi:MAG: hypothetical protein ABSB67_15715 [Bryobacteraceae bacterium]|jgi:uncharacterized membrane protein
MPFCTSCGNTVQPTDVYCAKCGGRQPRTPPSDPLSGISPRTASLLCYIPVLGWIAAIVVLASSRFRRDATVRFNAFQGLYLFVAWLIVDQAVGWFFSIPFPGSHFHHALPDLLKLVIFGAWIFMIVKVAHNEHYKLPIVGDLAEKSLSEQR